jgi:hypothetical protein
VTLRTSRAPSLPGPVLPRRLIVILRWSMEWVAAFALRNRERARYATTRSREVMLFNANDLPETRSASV